MSKGYQLSAVDWPWCIQYHSAGDWTPVSRLHTTWRGLIIHESNIVQNYNKQKAHSSLNKWLKSCHEFDFMFDLFGIPVLTSALPFCSVYQPETFSFLKLPPELKTEAKSDAAHMTSDFFYWVCIRSKKENTLK